MNIAQLLVRNHLVFKLHALLALVLELGENLKCHFDVFKVHSDLAESFHHPIQAEESFFLIFFDQVAEGFKDHEDCYSFKLAGLVCFLNETGALNNRILMLSK